MDFVHQTGIEALLQDARGADDNILLSRSLLCLTNGTFNTIRDKDER